MRMHAIACAAIIIGIHAGCAGELAERPATADPTNPASEEAPFRQPPAYAGDPLLAPPSSKAVDAPPKANEPPPAERPTHDHAHSPQPAPKREYTCPMHPEVRSDSPGKCPKCGMTLVPVEPKGRAK